jgi:NAD(P)-dependent dehydrogenase (short-subunit alcohol dehydrogenase family)
MFEVNVFGLAGMIHAVLPGMRARRGGHVVNISSIGGLRAFPAVGYYNATKFAVVGLSEALALEVGPLGIHVTVVEPSGFRTDWAGRSASEAPDEIADYAETAGRTAAASGARAGASRATPSGPRSDHRGRRGPEPPLHLLLGKAALRGARLKLEALQRTSTRGRRRPSARTTRARPARRDAVRR